MTYQNGIIILGTSRSDGNTAKVVASLAERTGYSIVDLATLNIGYYDYEAKNRDDDFLPLMRDIVASYDVLVFATPVYWYTMSAQLKTFFDRLSDLLRIEKDTGRKLRGKSMLVISSSEADDVPPHFVEPFVMSAGYLGMNFLGYTHAHLEDGQISAVAHERLDNITKLLHND